MRSRVFLPRKKIPEIIPIDTKHSLYIKYMRIKDSSRTLKYLSLKINFKKGGVLKLDLNIFSKMSEGDWDIQAENLFWID